MRVLEGWMRRVLRRGEGVQGWRGEAWVDAARCKRRVHQGGAGGWVGGRPSQTLVLLRRASSLPARA
eukprot:10709062-Prorocentrum_lima.AAC.1